MEHSWMGPVVALLLMCSVHRILTAAEEPPIKESIGFGELEVMSYP